MFSATFNQCVFNVSKAAGEDNRINAPRQPAANADPQPAPAAPAAPHPTGNEGDQAAQNRANAQADVNLDRHDLNVGEQPRAEEWQND